MDYFERNNKLHLAIILNILAIAFYFFIAINFGYLEKTPTSMFSTIDARTYLEVADWIYGINSTTTYARLRPFFYPLLLGVYYLGGVYLVWFVHFLLWLSSINLIGLSIYQLTHRNIPVIIAFAVFTLNISLIALTFHAFSEITVMFLLSLWLFLFIRQEDSLRQTKNVFLLTFILSLLVVVKPVYLYHQILFVVFVIWRIFIRNQIRLKNLIILLIALLPIFIQIFIMIDLYATPKISEIGTGTLREYYFSKVYMNVEKLPDLQAARIQVQDYDTSQMISYLLNNLRTAAVILFENIFRNFLSPSSYVDRNAYWSLFLYTLATNMSYTLLHLMFPPVIYLRRGDPLNHATKLYLVYIFFVLIAITSGISFFQGDRLIVVAIPLWLTVYLYSISSIRSLDQQIVTKQQPIISS